MTPLDYAATYAVYVLSSAGAAFIVLRGLAYAMHGWAVLIKIRGDL